MILAAGLGTRLRPLTDNRPKALVEVAGRTLLEITLSRLREFGIRDVIINVHHFADLIVDYLRQNDCFGMHIELSREEVLLDTGGGLKKAGSFFLREGRDDPFVLHNVDVISAIDLQRMFEFHVEHQALATLAVQRRESARYLLFDEQQQLCGRQLAPKQTEVVRAVPHVQPLAFSGIHVISPRLLTLMPDETVFSIIAAYLQLAARGEKILAFPADQWYWRDLGRPDHIQQAAEDLKHNVLLR